MLFCSLLSLASFASTVLATPLSRFGAHTVRPREARLSQLNDRLEQSTDISSNANIYSSNWAGAIWDMGNGTFTSVTGTFTVPTPDGDTGAAASIWVGIDGDTCVDAILQTGVDFTIFGDYAWYYAWYEWYPEDAQYFTGIDITAGDVVKLTVVASSATMGSATIENLTTGQTISQNLSSNSPLCQQNAEWIVEDFQESGELVPFANFSMVSFTDAVAAGTGTVLTPSGATLVDVKQNDQVLTSVSINGPSLVITYV